MREKIRLKDIAIHSKGQQIKGTDLIDHGRYDYLNGGINPSGKWNEYNNEGNTVTISEGGNSSGYVNYMVEPFWCGAHCYYLYDVKGNSKYLYYALKSKQEQIMHLRTGATMPNIKKSVLGEFTFTYDNNVEEQVKVVQMLEKTEMIIENRKAQLTELDKLIKSRFVEMFGDSEVNSMSWHVYPLGELCKVGSSKRIYKTEQTMTGIPFLRISDLMQRIENDKETSDLFIADEQFIELKDSGLVPKVGEILVTARGTLGECYIIKSSDEFYFQDGMISWLSNITEAILPVYIHYLFRTQGIKRQIQGFQAGSTVAYLSIAMLKQLEIMLPPIEVQNEFADFIQKVDKLKVEVKKSLDETQLLFDSLMQKYFE